MGRQKTLLQYVALPPRLRKTYAEAGCHPLAWGFASPATPALATPSQVARGSGNSVDCSPGLTPWAKSWRPWRDSEFTEPSIAGFNFARHRRISILRRSNFDCRRQISLPALKRAIQIVNSIVGRSKSRLQGTNYEVVFSCAQRAQGIWSPRG